jgi:hypothetical protein
MLMEERSTVRPPGSHRAARPLVAIVVGLLGALVASSPVAAAVSWSAAHRASPDSAFAWHGGSLARTVVNGTARLHTVFTRYVIGGVPVDDDGPYLGVYYERGSAGGSSWSSARRLNSTTEHGDAGAIATSGRFVYAVWRTQVHDPLVTGDPRLVRFVRNTDAGADSGWKAIETIVSSGRVDRPTIAAAGSRVYIAYTNADNGQVRVRRSTDNGASFQLLDTVLGTTTVTGNDGGFAGSPVIAASGDLVAVAWDTSTGIWARFSTNRGNTFGSAEQLTTDSTRWLAATARGGRVAFAWIEPEDAGSLRIWKNGTLGPARQFRALGAGHPDLKAFEPAIALAGTSRVGVSYSVCITDACNEEGGADIQWRESVDNGATWKARVIVGSHTASDTRLFNASPSVLFPSAGKRIVLFNAGGGDVYRNLVRVGSS